MQSSNQGQTPQFIKTMDYNDDCVRNSMEGGPNNQMIQQNYRSYKSPGRGGYESRYPASYNGYCQDNENLSMNFSPAKYTMNANNLNARRGNFAVETSPQEQLSRGGYVSPPRSNTFIPSPYVSQNYRPISQNQAFRSQPPLYPPSNMQTTKSTMQLQKLVSELKISLQQSLSVQSSLQQQLHKERSRSFELSEIKRKLQEELSKMEFQLDKIMNSDVLGQRELAIKYEAVSLQNQRLNSQINDLMDQLKRVKKECRQVMTQNNQSKQQCEILKQQNGELIQKVDQLAEEIKVLKHEYNQSVLRQQQKLHQQNMMRIQNQQQYYIPSNGHIPSNGNINTITTTRTHEEESGQGSHLMSPTQKNARSFQNPKNFMIKSPFNNVNYAPQGQNVVGGYVNVQQSQSQEYIGSSQAINSNLKNQLNYEMENSKLVDDYNKLLAENESMKKLYKQFYQQSPRKVASFNSPPNSQHQRSISEYSEEYESSYRQNGEEFDTQRLQTFQKHELFGQISSLRQEIVNDLMRKYYAQALHQAEVKKTNVLVCFIKLMSRDLQLIQKMVANYLQARDLLKKQLNVKRLQEGEQGNPTTKPQIEAEGMWQTVKQKLKVELKSHKNSEANRPSNQSELVTLNINAYFLGLFRLLTLINKHEAKDIDPQSKTLSKIKHSALKYVQKIYEESYLLKLNSKKNTVISYNSGDKVSMKK